MIKLPLIVLGVGDVVKDKRLLTVSDANGVTILPVFTDPTAAENYRLWQEYNMRENTIPVSCSGCDDNNRYHSINAVLLNDLTNTKDVFSIVAIVNPTIMVAINPIADSPALCLCFQIDELLEELEG